MQCVCSCKAATDVFYFITFYTSSVLSCYKHLIILCLSASERTYVKKSHVFYIFYKLHEAFNNIHECTILESMYIICPAMWHSHAQLCCPYYNNSTEIWNHKENSKDNKAIVCETCTDMQL